MHGLAAAVRSLWVGVTASDAVLAGLLCALGLADALTQDEYGGGTTRLAVAAFLQTAPLVWRRSRTVLAVGLSFLGVGIEIAGTAPYGGVYGLIGFLLLVHAVSRWATGAQQRAGLAVLAGGMAVHLLSQSNDGPLGILGSVVLTGAFSAFAWSIGQVTRRSERREREWDLRNAEVLEEERRRISRDLHDVLGHALAGISLTAGAAEQRATDGGVADQLRLIRTMSRDAAADVRRLVGLLREDADHEPGPQPTLDQLPSLVDRARAAGTDATLEVTGEPVQPPPALQLTAYRIVQEGLTNVAKHAPGARADVRLEWSDSELLVAVENTATGRSFAGHGYGHGLTGLTERVTVFGGRLLHGPTAAGGFRLEARLPL